MPSKNLLLPMDKFLSLCANQECNNVTTPYYPISAQLSVKWSVGGGGGLQTEEKFKLLGLKVAVVAYERLTTSSKYSDLT